MNTKNKLLLGIILIFLVGSFLFISAKSFDSNSEDGKISFFDWLKNLFKFDITGKAIEEGFTDYITEDYNYIPADSKITQLEATQNVKIQQDTGILTFQGIGTNSFVKINNQEFDLSGENDFLEVNSMTGEITKGKFKVSDRHIGKGVYSDSLSFSETQKLNGIPAGSTIFYENGNLKVEFSEKYSGLYGKETLELNNVKEFDISFSGANSKDAQLTNLNFKSEQGSSMKFLNGEFSLTDGQVSMSNGVWNFPDGSGVEKFPLISSEKKMNVKLGNYPLEAEMVINGKDLKINKNLMAGLEQDLDFNGHLALKNKNIFVPPSKDVKINNFGTKVSSIGTPGRSASNAYLFFDENTAKISGKENYAMMSDIFDFKTGGIIPTGTNAGQIQINFDKTNPWFGDNNPYGGNLMQENDYINIFGEATGGSSSFTLYSSKTEKGILNNPSVVTQGSFSITQDSKKMFVNPEIGPTGKLTIKELINSDTGKPLFEGTSSVPLIINSELKSFYNKETKEFEPQYAATIFTNNPDKIFFADLGASPRIDLTNRQSEELIEMPEAFVPEFQLGQDKKIILAVDKADILGDKQFVADLRAHDAVVNRFKTIQQRTSEDYENLIRSAYGQTNGDQMLAIIRSSAGDPTAILRAQNFLKSNENLPDLGQQPVIDNYRGDIVGDLASVDNIRGAWVNNYGFDVGSFPNLTGRGDIPGQAPRFGWRMYTANYDISKFTILAGYW